VEIKIGFQNQKTVFLMNRKSKRTAFIVNRFFFCIFLHVFTVTFDTFTASKINV